MELYDAITRVGKDIYENHASGFIKGLAKHFANGEFLFNDKEIVLGGSYRVNKRGPAGPGENFVRQMNEIYTALENEPRFAPVVYNLEGAMRVLENDYIKNRVGNPGAPYVSCYGESAQFFREGIEHFAGDNPRILIMGAIAPYSVEQVTKFTGIYQPEIILADKSEELMRLMQATELDVKTYSCDFGNKFSMGELPDFDLVIADKLLHEIENIERFFENISQRGAGIVFVNHYETNNDKKIYESLFGLDSLNILDCKTPAKNFRVLPSLDELCLVDYDFELVDNKYAYTLVAEPKHL